MATKVSTSTVTNLIKALGGSSSSAANAIKSVQSTGGNQFINSYSGSSTPVATTQYSSPTSSIPVSAPKSNSGFTPEQQAQYDKTLAMYSTPQPSVSPSGNVKVSSGGSFNLADYVTDPNKLAQATKMMNEAGYTTTGQAISSEPQFNIPTTQTTSEALGTYNTYQDLLAKQQKYYQMAQEALQNQLETQYAGLAGVENARYASSLEDVGLGRAGMAERQATLKNLAASVPLQVATQGLGFTQQALQNTLAAQPTTAIQQLPDGTLVGVRRDPTTGQTTIVPYGNYALGTPGVTPGAPSAGGIPVQVYKNGQIQTAPIPINIYNIASKQVPINGANYINDFDVPDFQKNVVKAQANQYGIPYLSADDTKGVQATAQAFTMLDNIDSFISKTTAIQPGVLGRLSGMTTTQIQKWLQTPEGSKLKAYEATIKYFAVKQMKALSGGSGGSIRIGNSLIDMSGASLPSDSDNLETNLFKTNAIRSQLAIGLNYILPNQHVPENAGDVYGTGIDTGTSSDTIFGKFKQDASGKWIVVK